MNENPVIIKQGDQVGDVVVGELLDITWVPAGGGRQTSNLVILDKKGMLYDYSPTFGVKHRPLADTAKWLFPQAVHGFYGNLYVLDTHLNQILKYLPTTADNGYSSSPLDYLGSKAKVDLSGAVDIAIDGSIYVLYANGTITKFLNGEQVCVRSVRPGAASEQSFGVVRELRRGHAVPVRRRSGQSAGGATDQRRALPAPVQSQYERLR